MRDLVTLSEYKVYSSIASTEYDAKIQGIITKVSALIKEYCGRTLIDYSNGTSFLDIEEYFDGSYQNYYTREFPIQSINTIEYSYDNGQNYTSLVEFTDYALSKQKDRIAILHDDGTEQLNKYRLVYTAGFLNTPEDLKLAVLDLVDYYYKGEATPKRMSNFVTIEYVKTSDFPPHIKRILDLYRTI